MVRSRYPRVHIARRHCVLLARANSVLASVPRIVFRVCRSKSYVRYTMDLTHPVKPVGSYGFVSYN